MPGVRHQKPGATEDDMMNRIRIGLAAMLLTALSACGGGGDTFTPPPGTGGPSTPELPNPASAPALKTVLATKFGMPNFPVGAAIEPSSTTNATDSALLTKHFSSITAENVMKPDTIWPSMPGTSQPAASPNFTQADLLVNFAAVNGMQVRGHTLLWHQSIPAWMLDGDGHDLTTDPVNYRLAVQQHLRTYIFAVIQHPAFANVYAWDVVNEVSSDTPNDPNPYRQTSLWYIAYNRAGMSGADYVRDAFLFATQARASIGKNSATMKLMLNDYNTEIPGKRANVLQIVRDIQNSGVGADINGVGHQFHLQLDADVTQVTAALAAVEALPGNLVNHVTELDVSIYADPGTCYAQRTIPPCLADYGVNPPQAALSQQATLYRALFNAFNRPSVTSVSLWGIADNHTWLNAYPVVRTNRPLLFDTAGNPKWAFWTVVDPTITVP
jgi:endo-1,4-beta-xylanase